MTNIVLQPDKNGQTLEEMIEETKDGFYSIQTEVGLLMISD